MLEGANLANGILSFLTLGQFKIPGLPGGCDKDYGPICILTYCASITNPADDYYCRAARQNAANYNAAKLGHRRSLLQAPSTSSSTDNYEYSAAAIDTRDYSAATDTSSGSGDQASATPVITDIHDAMAMIVPGLQAQDVALTSLEHIVTVQIVVYNAPEGADLSMLSAALALDATPGPDSVKISSIDADTTNNRVTVMVEMDGYVFEDAAADYLLLKDPSSLDQTAEHLNRAWGIDTSQMAALAGTSADCSLPPISYPDNACPACPQCVYFDVPSVNAYAVHAVSATVPTDAVGQTERIMHDAVMSGRLTSALAAAQLASSSSSDAAGRRRILSFTPAYGADVASLTPVQAVRYARVAPQPGYAYVSAAVSLGGMDGADFGYLQSAMFSAAIARSLNASAADVFVVAVGAAVDVIAAASAAVSRRRALLSSAADASTFSVGFSVGTTSPDAVTASVNSGAISVGGLRAAGLSEVTALELIVAPSTDVRQPTDVAGSLPLLPLRTNAEQEHDLLGLIALIALLPIGLAAGFVIGRRTAPARGVSSSAGGSGADLDGGEMQRKPAHKDVETLAAAAV